MITQENFEKQYSDPIEQQQIDKFVCVEMGRQIHRKIKGMYGTLAMMHRFEEQLAHLNTEQRQLLRHVQLYARIYQRQTKGELLSRPYQKQIYPVSSDI